MGRINRRFEGHLGGGLLAIALLLHLLAPLASGQAAPAGQEVPQAQAPSPAPAGSVTATPAPEEFHYNSAGRRDPFKSLLVLQEKKKDVSMLPPPQQVDLQVFKVLGVVVDKVTGNMAMIQAPDGKTFIIKKGDIIGKNEGEVVSIGLDGISVREKFVDFMNRETVVTTVLKIPEKLK